MMNNHIEHLFIYGTLAPGRPNEHILKPFSGTWTPATIRGELLPDGWGAALGYPAVIPKADGETIHGFIFASYEIDWQMLDEFEGEGYNRITVTATMENGTVTQAFVYALNQNQSHKQ